MRGQVGRRLMHLAPLGALAISAPVAGTALRKPIRTLALGLELELFGNTCIFDLPSPWP